MRLDLATFGRSKPDMWFQGAYSMKRTSTISLIGAKKLVPEELPVGIEVEVAD